MQRIALQDAQTELQQLVDAAVRGETVLIVGNDQQVVQLVPVESDQASAAKRAAPRGLLPCHDDFDAPLPDFNEYME